MRPGLAPLQMPTKTAKTAKAPKPQRASKTPKGLDLAMEKAEPSTSEKLDAFGESRVCDLILEGHSMSFVARTAGVSMGQFWAWLVKSSERSAKIHEARVRAAARYEEMGLERIERAEDPFELAKAKEIAQHLRWRAAKIAPRQYGDKVTQEHTGPEGGPVQIKADLTISPAEAYEKMIRG